jgi:sugar lactone lactonase YvrE
MELLVLMHDSGRVERYELETGKHLGTLLSGLPPSNALLIDSDGRLLISTGKPNEMGTVLRYDPAGRMETFIQVPEGYGGRLHRATGMAWHRGDLLVASQGDGKVKRYAYPSGEWLDDIALASPGGMTQIALQGDELYVTDYQAQAIRKTNKLDGSMSVIWAQHQAQHPWGLCFDSQGAAFWCTSGNRILRTVGSETVEWAGAGGGIATPLCVAIGPDGWLYCASWLGDVTAWRIDSVNAGEPVRTIRGPEVKGPISFAFTDRSLPPEFAYTPSTGLNETPEKVAMFESRIRPLLHDRCIECHDQDTQEGGLRLDLRAGWELGGHTGPAIVPGRPDESLLYRAVVYLDKDLQMPPDGPLAADDVQLLRQWIEHGAIDPRQGQTFATKPAIDAWSQAFQERLDWWSLKPLSNPAVPEVEDPLWNCSPVDRFIRSRLAQNGLQPAPPAQPEDLLRRVSFVLTGLPPTPPLRESFLASWQIDSERAYTELVDHLLASPHYGEAIARHWMDVVRYTDTYGYEWDNPAKGSHEYRDYLIRGFNNDIGFDTLLIEQIAGDLLTESRVDHDVGVIENRIGLMFYHMGEHRHGSSRDFNGIHQEMVNNKIDAFSKAFLATTVACSRCHDHKLEAVSQKDYYALGAMFITPRWASRPIDASDKNRTAINKLQELRSAIRDELASLWRSNEFRPADWRNAVSSYPEKQEPQFGDIDYPLFQLAKETNNPESNNPESSSFALAWQALASQWQTHRNARSDANQAFTVLADFSEPKLPTGWVMEGQGFETGWVDEATPLVALEGDTIVARLLPRGLHTHALSSKLPGVIRMPPQHTIPGSIVSVKLAGGEYAGTLILDENSIQSESVAFLNQVQPSWRSYGDLPLKNGITRVTIDFATASLNSNFPPRTGLAAGLPNQDFGYDKRSWLSVTQIVSHDTSGAPLDRMDFHINLLDRPAPQNAEEADARVTQWLKEAVARWCDGSMQPGDGAIVDWMIAKKLLPNQASAGSRLASLVQTYRDIEQTIPYPRSVNSMDERASAKSGMYFNVRGNVDTVGDLVMPSSLSMFGPDDSIQQSPGSGRLELAQSLVRPEHPLTSRVAVNRVWQWVFGTGIVASPDDFGRLGDKPSHPELLDWLARDFMVQRWSIKTLVRQLVLSQTFRQSGTVHPLAQQRDPSNRLRHHYPTRRLEAEQIRDSLLAVSGRLDPSLFGRPILPPRNVEDGAKRLFSGPVDGHGRRSIYLMMSIMNPPKFLTTFDLPELKLPSGRRNVTSVPTQALLMLNDPLVAQLAKHWASEIIQQPHRNPGERIDAMVIAAWGRQSNERERNHLEALLREVSANDDHIEYDLMMDKGAWAHLAHTLFNTKEFIHTR